MSRRPVPKRVRFLVLRRDGFSCRYCGAVAPAAHLHVDHVNPVVRGGTNDAENLVTACADCNLGKGALAIDDGINDAPERAIAASMMTAALQRWGASVSPTAFSMLLDFSLMAGPQPALIELVASANSWADAERALYKNAEYPEWMWSETPDFPRGDCDHSR